MPTQRYVYTVMVDRDQVPGFNYQPEDFREMLQRWLNNTASHYNPIVHFSPTLSESASWDTSQD